MLRVKTHSELSTLTREAPFVSLPGDGGINTFIRIPCKDTKATTRQLVHQGDFSCCYFRLGILRVSPFSLTQGQ